jgi:DNA-binding XRE family transcriptional regulator
MDFPDRESDLDARFPDREKYLLTRAPPVSIFPLGKTKAAMTDRNSIGSDHARRLGALIRSRREAMNLRLDDLASAAGVGRRFLHELETGKPSCQLGLALAVAAAVGLRPLDLLDREAADESDLPPMTTS